eukprot:GILJ01004405.1.p1 GENE.GILJ01004405.1~~GILJ01004405.1.p1  ORF type:complete len:498 (-),score=81.87 GILJ01004405.1:118-1563(-)
MASQEELSTEIQQLGREMHDYALCQGLCMVAANPGGQQTGSTLYAHAPISILPTDIPKELFERAQSIAEDFNLLVDRCSRDSQWLLKTLSGVLSSDSFTANLVSIFEKVLAEGISQPWYLGLHRSDYMVNQPPSGPHSILQVELNTIASSFGCLATDVSRAHEFAVKRFGPHIRGRDYESSRIPHNNAAEELSAGIVGAWTVYGVPEAVVLFIVQKGERNVFDQRKLEYAIWNHSQKVRVIRRSLDEVNARAQLDENTKKLTLDGYEIAVVYFRAGYTPTDYPTQAEWDGRLTLERSMAIKCPAIAYHLSGTKKVQQALAKPGQLERFMTEPDAANRLRSCFAGLWGLEADDEEGVSAVQDALIHPEKYVLKPQREGGGNNIYGAAVAHALQTFSAEERAAHILMERIHPPIQKALMMRNGQVMELDSISELGIYGTFLGNGSEIKLNKRAGHLLRTKSADSDEGGVAAGFAVVDSPYLVD